MATTLRLGIGNVLFYENGQAVKVNGHYVRKWKSDNARWSLSTGGEVFKGKTIFDLEKILGLFFFDN